MRAIALVRRAVDLPLVRAAAALGETVAISAAPDEPETRALLAGARAAGAARLVRVWDPSLAAADYLGVAYVLAAAVRAVVGDVQTAAPLIVAGDRGRGAVGPALAERLGLPLVGQALAIAAEDGQLRVDRRSRGLVRRLGGAPPAVVCLLVDETVTPLVPDAAAAGEIDGWTLAQVGMSAAELGYRRRFAPTPAPGAHAAPSPLRLPDAAALVARLRADGLLRDGDRAAGGLVAPVSSSNASSSNASSSNASSSNASSSNASSSSSVSGGGGKASR